MDGKQVKNIANPTGIYSYLNESGQYQLENLISVKLVAPAFTDTSIIGHGTVIDGIALFLGQYFFCTLNSSFETGVFLVGSTSSTLVLFAPNVVHVERGAVHAQSLWLKNGTNQYVKVQKILESGANIKTINGASLLGSGDIVVGGGGSTTLTEIEIDFGTSPVPSKKFIINDALVGASNKIVVYPSPNSATDRVGNDWEVDKGQFTALASTATFALYYLGDRIVGKRKVYYQII